MFHQPPKILDGLINQDSIKLLDYIVVMSPDQADYFAQYVAKENIHVILHGIDTDYFRPIENKHISGTLRCIAGGTWLRDYQSLFDTARLLKDQDIEFHIIASNLDLPNDLNNVSIYENISDDKYRELFDKSDVLFMPMEAATANNVILEGIACGLPVISSNLDSIRAYLPGDEAILVENNDPCIFADTIINLLREPGRVTMMSNLARRRAEELSWKNVAMRYSDFYMEIVEDREVSS